MQLSNDFYVMEIVLLLVNRCFLYFKCMLKLKHLENNVSIFSQYFYYFHKKYRFVTFISLSSKLNETLSFNENHRHTLKTLPSY